MCCSNIKPLSTSIMVCFPFGVLKFSIKNIQCVRLLPFHRPLMVVWMLFLSKATEALTSLCTNADSTELKWKKDASRCFSVVVSCCLFAFSSLVGFVFPHPNRKRVNGTNSHTLIRTTGCKQRSSAADLITNKSEAYRQVLWSRDQHIVTQSKLAEVIVHIKYPTLLSDL